MLDCKMLTIMLNCTKLNAIKNNQLVQAFYTDLPLG